MILCNDDSGYPPLSFWIMKIKAEITAIYQELFGFVKNSEWTNKKLDVFKMVVSWIGWNCPVKFI